MVMADETIRVMSFNLRYASAPDGDNAWSNANQAPQRRDVAVRVITNRNPDVIGFQEGEAAQLDYLASQLPEYTFDRRGPSGGGGNENACIAYKTNRIELLDRDVFSLGPSPGGGYWNNTPSTPFDPWDLFPGMNFNFPRLAMRGHMRWKATGQEFLFYTTHFDVYNGANQGDVQVRSAHLIVDDALARCDRMPSSPLAIVVGDFNGSQNDRAWKLFTGQFTTNGLTGDFTDSWYQVHNTWNNSGTMHNFAGGVLDGSKRIDWVLHRGGFTATQAVVVSDAVLATNLTTSATRTQYPSDHYPVLALLRLPPVAADIDRDGLSDAKELSRPGSLPADPDTDDDGLLDGQEDLNGNGGSDGGETDATAGGHTQLPTDIRNHTMNGVRDYAAGTIAQHGLDLFYRFDGRYLYVATQDAGEGNDHFIFVTTNPAASVAAPWAKSGQVSPRLAFLADENDSGFSGWFDASGSLITNNFLARSATYFENGGRLEGVLDIAQLLGAGFTSTFYLAAAPYGNADGGGLITSAQAPDGNGDANLVGTNEFVKINPGDVDLDGISDIADPDRDGDGLSDAWTAAHGLAAGSGATDHDGDGVPSALEFVTCTNPTNPASVFEVSEIVSAGITWTAVHGKRYVTANSFDGVSWSGFVTNSAVTNFPEVARSIPLPALSHAMIRVTLLNP